MVMVQVLVYIGESHCYRDHINAFIIPYNPLGHPQWWSKVENPPFSKSLRSAFSVLKLVGIGSLHIILKALLKKSTKYIFLLPF